jgi:uncharacterized OB-fold protein
MTTTEQVRVDDGLAAAPVFDYEMDGVRLLGSRCKGCGLAAFPRRRVCLRCGGEQEPLRLGGEGHIHAWTRMENPPAGFEGELLYGAVDLSEGPRVLAPLAGRSPRTGDPVQAVAGTARNGAIAFRFEVQDA